MTERDMGSSENNISTENQKEGDARRPSDTLDRDRTRDTEDDDKEQIGRG